MKKSKSKTFQKGDPYHEMFDFLNETVEAIEWQPEGTESYGDGLTPFDPRCDLDAKYIITITKISDDEKANS